MRSVVAINPFYKESSFYFFFVPLAVVYTCFVHVAFYVMKCFYPEYNVIAPFEEFDVKRENTSEGALHIAIVTGSNTGIGYETALSLCELGYDVIIACRSSEKGKKAAQNINRHKKSGGKALFLRPLDLSSFESIIKFTTELKRKYRVINILVNNAGINNRPGILSPDGLNLVFQTNIIGHYLLTRKLLPQLLEAKNQRGEAGRVVNLSSVTHHFSGCYDTKKEAEDWWRRCTHSIKNTYKESKLAAILFTKELNQRYGCMGLRAISVNPGSVNSDIWRNYPAAIRRIKKLFYLTPKEGSTTSLAAAVTDLPKDALYLQPYWQPWGKKSELCYRLPIPFTEMLGIYIGYAVTDCRLPPYHDAPSALWNVLEVITSRWLYD